MFGEKLGLRHTPICGRFRIGSSNVHNLIHKDVDVRDAHGDYFSGPNRHLGSKAEDSVRDRLEDLIVIEKPFLVSEDFPFICATPDFIGKTEEGEVILIEVKSGAQMKEMKSNSRSKRSLDQVKTAMHVFGIQKGWIVPVDRGMIDSESGGLYPHLVVNETNFLYKHRKRVIEGYVEFLQRFFYEIYRILPEERMKDRLVKVIEERVPRTRINTRTSTITEIIERVEKEKVRGRIVCKKHPKARAPHNLDGIYSGPAEDLHTN